MQSDDELLNLESPSESEKPEPKPPIDDWLEFTNGADDEKKEAEA
jgi:hypothetical protein